MPSRMQTALVSGVGVVSLAAAFSMARGFWGVFVSYYFWPDARGVAGLIAHSAIAAPVGAVPFGFLFGLSVQNCTLKHAAYFSAASAVLLLAFVTWAGFLSGPTWWVTPLDAVLFVCLFALSAAVASRSMPLRRWRARAVAALAFFALAALFFFGPSLYVPYMYAP